MKRLYIMFCFSDTFGGGQNYVNSKVKWLEKQNWDVLIFSAVEDFSNKLVSPWDALRKFRCYRSELFNHSPEYCGKRLTKLALNWMQESIGYDYESIIIESHTDFFAEWGELLAKKIHAKHICYLLDERLELYSAKQFLYYKFLRREVAGIASSSMKRLFDGYKDISTSEEYVLRASHDESVQDIENKEIQCLPKADYTIAYMGRDKQYCNNIVLGVAEFVKRHKENSVIFMIMGQISNLNALRNLNNVTVIELGFLNPIPRKFFDKVDVIIAGAGCATISAHNGTYTIVADAASCLSSGVLGYTVQTTLFSDGEKQTFDIELENVLVKHLYDDWVSNFGNSPSLDDSFQKHFAFIDASAQSKEYFNFKKYPQRNYKIKGKRDLYNRVRYALFPDVVWKIIKKQRREIK